MPLPSPCTVLSGPRSGGPRDHLFPGINPSEGTIKLFFFFSLCDCFFDRVPSLVRLTPFLPGPPAEVDLLKLRWMGHLGGLSRLSVCLPL